jgi:hypothetical protein
LIKRILYIKKSWDIFKLRVLGWGSARSCDVKNVKSEKVKSVLCANDWPLWPSVGAFLPKQKCLAFQALLHDIRCIRQGPYLPWDWCNLPSVARWGCIAIEAQLSWLGFIMPNKAANLHNSFDALAILKLSEYFLIEVPYCFLLALSLRRLQCHYVASEHNLPWAGVLHELWRPSLCYPLTYL